VNETLPDPDPVTEPKPENPDAEPDEDEDEELEPEPEPSEPSEPSSETVLAERHKALASETRRHETRLRTIYGNDFESLAVCPLCLADGWIVPAPPGAMPPEQWEAVQLASGQVAERVLLKAKHTIRCEDCDGWGMVDTDARNEHTNEIQCPACEGKGWKAKLGEQHPPPTFALPVPPPPNGAVSIDWTRPKDNWGRPEGHPHFGMEPSLVGIS